MSQAAEMTGTAIQPTEYEMLMEIARQERRIAGVERTLTDARTKGDRPVIDSLNMIHSDLTREIQQMALTAIRAGVDSDTIAEVVRATRFSQ